MLPGSATKHTEDEKTKHKRAPEVLQSMVVWECRGQTHHQMTGGLGYDGLVRDGGVSMAEGVESRVGDPSLKVTAFQITVPL